MGNDIMIREKTDNLYFVKCRHCIMDIINSYSVDGKEIIPRPDYVDYYTIVKKNNDETFTSVFNKNKKFTKYIDNKNTEEHYSSDIIFSLIPLSDYIKNIDSLSKRECLIVLDIITKINGYKTTYGYKLIYNEKSKDVDKSCTTLRKIK